MPGKTATAPISGRNCDERACDSQQRKGEAFADDRWDVLDGEVEDDHIDEDVDHVGRAGAEPSAEWTSCWKWFCGGCPK